MVNIIIIIINLKRKEQMSRIIENNTRTNYQLDQRPPTTTHTQIYLLTTNKNSSIVNSVQRLLDSHKYNYQLQEISPSLTQLVINANKKSMVLVEISQENPVGFTAFLKNIKTSQQIKTITFGSKAKETGYTHYNNQLDLQQFLKTYFNDKNNNKIRLASVHSIKSIEKNVAPTKSTLKSPKTDHQYAQILYYKNIYSEQQQLSPLYQLFIQSIQGQKGFQGFKSAKDLVKKEEQKDKKRYLVLLSTNEKSLSLLRDIKKINKNLFDFMLLGDLSPNQQLLDKNIILASNQTDKHISFLINNGFQSYTLQQLLQTHRKTKPNIYTPYNQTYRMENQSIININSQALHKQDVNKIYTSPKGVKNGDDQSSNGDKKKIIKKMKSPHKQKKYNEEETRMNNNFNNNTINSKYNTQHNDMRQLQKGVRRQFTQQINKHDNHYTSAPYDNHYTNNQHQIDSKYTIIPSAIIHEHSDEYRGSNKESIVNLQPELSHKSMKQVAANHANHNISHIKYSSNINPQEENTSKKIVSKSSISHYPQRQYIHISQNTIEQPLPTNNNIYNKSIYASKMGNQDRNHYSPNNYISNKSIEEPNSNKNIYISNSSSRKIEENNNQYGSNLPKVVSPYSPQRITAPSINVYPANANNTNTSSNSLNYSSSTGGIYQLGGSGAVSPTRTYGKSPQSIQSSSYTTQGKVTIRKNNITSPQIVNINQQSRNQINNQHRLTFGNIKQAETSSQNKQFNNNNTHNNNNSTSGSSYYNKQTLNYNDINRSISPQQPEESKNYYNNHQVKTYGTSHPTNIINNISNPSKNYEEVKTKHNHQHTEVKTSIASNNSHFNGNGINWDDYQKVERDGITVFRKKGAVNSPPKASNYYDTNSNKNIKQFHRQSQSPKVQRYQVSPLRDKPYTTETSTYEVKSHTQDGNNYARYESPTKRYQAYSSSYANKPADYGGSKPVDYEHMIESSIKKQVKQDGKYGAVVYRTQTKQYTSNNGNSGTKVYGVQYEPVQINRYQHYGPKIQAANSIYAENKAAESQTLTKTEQSISDHSILKNNNIRFGVKLKKREREESILSINNKKMSWMYGLTDLNKKMALNRVIRGQEYLQQQMYKYRHINTKFNHFHFLVQEQLSYVSSILQKHILTNRDKQQTFTGVDGLFNCLKQEKMNEVDGGYIFIRREDLHHINIDLIPQDYYFVLLQSEKQECLYISQLNKQIKMNNLKYLNLCMKIILDSKLYQYVVYFDRDKDMQGLMKKFINSQFIVQKLQTQFSVDILDCYYSQYARFTRSYILCHPNQVQHISQLKRQYLKLNPLFDSHSCKIICFLGQKDYELKLQPAEDIIFISNSHLIDDCKEILVHQDQKLSTKSLQYAQDTIYYHNFHHNLQRQLSKEFPGRFQYKSFDKMSQISNNKRSNGHSTYLILSEQCKNQKINMDNYDKVYMFGKVKVVGNKVIRIMNSKQLLELLRK